MPSQAEFDPIFENVDKKLKDFGLTLSEFRIEAAAADRERFDADMKAVGQAQQLIQATHSGTGKKAGVNLQRLVGILSMVDDMAMDAATWKSLAELKMCQQMIQHEDPNRYSQFGIRVAMNSDLLHEVGGQLLNPMLRAAAAADNVILAVLDATSKNEPKRH
jgi:hypothetical protein